MSENDNKESRGQLKGFVIFFLVATLLIGAFICVVFLSDASSSATGSASNGATPSNGYHFEVGRKASNSDILFDCDIDLSSFGAKYTVTPQTDINNLVIELGFFDGNKNELSTQEKTIGNVKKGVQVSFSISLTEMSFSTVWNTKYISCRVVSGRVPIFS